MTKEEIENMREKLERVSFVLGCIMGGIYKLKVKINRNLIKKDDIYKDICKISKFAEEKAYDIYYKDIKNET